MKTFEQGRFIEFELDPNYWGKDLPVNRGRFNFDRIQVNYYRDRDIAFEAFKAGAFDYHEEFTSRVWATGYDFPAIKDGRVIRAEIPDHTPSGVSNESA